jgi:hypothetical protein
MKIIHILITFLSIGASLTGVIFLQEKSLQQNSQIPSELYKAETKADQVLLEIQARTPTLGFDNILADWNLLKFIQYFGDISARKQTGYELTPQFFQAIVKNDPRFTQALLMLSSANSLYALSPQKTVELLNQALTSITPQLSPLAPYIWTYKGVDEMLFLGDSKAAQHSYEMGAKWALERGGEEGKAVAKRNSETAQFLATNPNSKKARTASWMSILGNAINEETKQRAIKEIIALGGKVSINNNGEIAITFPEKD